jgi:hypothetical protein
VAEVIPTLRRAEEPEAVADGGPQFIDGATACGAEQPFQLGKPEFDRIEVGTVGRQVARAAMPSGRSCSDARPFF